MALCIVCIHTGGHEYLVINSVFESYAYSSCWAFSVFPFEIRCLLSFCGSSWAFRRNICAVLHCYLIAFYTLFGGELVKGPFTVPLDAVCPWGTKRKELPVPLPDLSMQKEERNYINKIFYFSALFCLVNSSFGQANSVLLFFKNAVILIDGSHCDPFFSCCSFSYVCVLRLFNMIWVQWWEKGKIILWLVLLYIIDRGGIQLVILLRRKYGCVKTSSDSKSMEDQHICRNVHDPAGKKPCKKLWLIREWARKRNNLVSKGCDPVSLNRPNSQWDCGCTAPPMLW